MARPSVADAAKVYPLGLESVMQQQRPAEQSSEGRSGFGLGHSGSGSDRRQIDAMMAAHHGDPFAIPALLTEAHDLYREDVDPDNPNCAPRIFWPSCHAYKVAMYFAGKFLAWERMRSRSLAKSPTPISLSWRASNWKRAP